MTTTHPPLATSPHGTTEMAIGIPDAAGKREIYHDLLQQAKAVLDGIDDPVTLLATAAAIVHRALPWTSWTGFYRVVAPELLRVGPYQGPVACLEIGFGSGVCGTAAAERRTRVVPDVHAFPGHIACDAAARSEIVVPVDDARGDLYAVLDLDSHRPAAFDEVDREGLEALAELLADGLEPGGP
jgi:L-methionine (R)-S-oxide reductase